MVSKRSLGMFLLAAAPFLLPSPSAADLTYPSQLGSYGEGELLYPLGIAIASGGETYVVSAVNSRVDKYSRFGSHLLAWGAPGTGPGQFDYAIGIAVDPGGDVFVVEANNARVQRFTSSGVYLSSFGGQGSGPGQLNSPRGVATDASGNIYVADTYNNRIQKFSNAGTYLAQWGTQGSGPGQLSLPFAVTVDGHGDVYVADNLNHRIEKFDATGVFLTQWGSQGTGDGQFNYPSAIQVDGGGNVYVADVNNHRVQRFTSTGVFVASWGSNGSGPGQFIFPQGVAVAPNGDLHVTDYGNGRVQVLRARSTSEHESLFTIGSPGGDNAQFSDIRGIAVAPDGTVYVADKNAGRIQRFNSFGAWLATWGSPGFGDGEFSGATGVAVDHAGYVYVADNYTRVQKFTAAGAYVSKWGTPGSGPGQLSAAWDLAVDDSDRVYVIDANRVERFSTAGVYQTEWAVPGARGVGIDREGFVYVTSEGDDRVHKYTPNGILVREWGSTGSGPGQFFHPYDVVADTAGYVYVCDANDRIQQFTAIGGYVAEWGEPGTQRRQLGAPQMMAADVAGNVYVTEFSNYRYQKFASPPQLLEIADVPGDEGGAVKITFARSSAEAPNSGSGLTEYTIYRKGPTVYTLVATIPVGGATSAVVASGANTTLTRTGMVEYDVRALVPIPGAHVPRETSYGFSVDNLAPPAPSPFTGAYVTDATHLHWGASGATDLSQYRLYRSDTPGFALSAANLIYMSPDTGYVDVGPAGRYYAIVAADTCGNVSGPSFLDPDQTVSAPEDGSDLAFRLEEVLPNPTRGRSPLVRFVLPTPQKARLELIDVSGRRMWGREVVGVGPHAVKIDGPRLATGIYFVRLVQAERELVRRFAVIQ